MMLFCRYSSIVRAKKHAKVLLFFDIRKRSGIFLPNKIKFYLVVGAKRR